MKTTTTNLLSYNPKLTHMGIILAWIIQNISPAQMVSAGESIQGTYKGTKK